MGCFGSLVVGTLGLGIYPLLMLAKRRKWLRFAVDSSLPDVATLEVLARDATEIEHDAEEEAVEGEAVEESLRDRLLFHSVSGGGGSGRRRSEVRSSSDVERDGKVFGKEEVVNVSGAR